MKVFDAFWRALAYCLMPSVLLLSLVPVLVMVSLVWVLSYFFWNSAVDAASVWLQSFGSLGAILGWLESWGMLRIRAVMAPALVLLLSLPVIVMGCLYLAALVVMPMAVALVSRRRFPLLTTSSETPWWQSVTWSMGSISVALVMLVVSLPLWLFPPMAILLPAFIWGWLTSRVMSFDALSAHATRIERRTIFQMHRTPMLVMGVMTGFMGAAPAVLWASAALFVVMAPVFVPLAVWVYTLTFVFASLWYAHYCLAALQELRAQDLVTTAAVVDEQTQLLEMK